MKFKFFTSILLFLLFSSFSVAKNIKGTVIDEDGDPIAYASVYVRTNPIGGTMTDLDGNYVLQIDSTSALDDELIFSFIGYRTEEFPIQSVINDSILNVTLVEQPIMLEGTVVQAKISRKESRKLKREALEKFVNQMAEDFPKRTAEYPIFSMYNGFQDDNQLIHHEVVGTIFESPQENKRGGDSIALVVKSVKEFTTEEAKIGYNKFNEIADDRLNHPKKKKKKKNKLTYTKRDLDDQTLRMHRFLWGGLTGSLIDMLDVKKPAKWDYTMIGDNAVLTYTEKENYLGIVKGELQLHFYVDPVTFQINKIAQSLYGELHIPFGYKLKEEELDFINALQFGHDTIDRYRVRHAYVDVLRNVFFRRVDGNVVIREKNLEVKGDIIDTKKKKLTYSAEAKSIVSGTPKISKREE